MPHTHYRHKSSQWVGLTRAHAELASADTVVWYVFQHHCGACIADEHYIPTLLSINGLSDGMRDGVSIASVYSAQEMQYQSTFPHRDGLPGALAFRQL